MGSIFERGLGFEETRAPVYDPQLNELQTSLFAQANSPESSYANQAYRKFANQAMGDVLSNIAQTKGVRPSGAATMMDIAGSRMAGQAAENAGLLAQEEKLKTQNLLGQLLMGRNQLDQQRSEGQANRFGNTFTGIVRGAGAAASGGGMMG